MTETTRPARWTEYLALESLLPNPANPKGHDTALIDASVGRFGYVEPITLDERTGCIISGHGRRETLIAMRDRGETVPEGVTVRDSDGAWLVPVARGWASRTDTEALAALVALNRTTEAGGWEEAALLDLLDRVSAIGDEAFAGVGFSEDDLDDLRVRLEEIAAASVEFDGDQASEDEGFEDDTAGIAPSPRERAVKDLPNVRDLVTLHHGDCIDVLKTLPDASVDAIVTDPPYELGFMGRAWDSTGIAYNVDLWRDTLRVLKPGGHMLAFGGSRTWHRLAAAVEDAGFEIRDSIAWLYGSGFPKSLDVSKAIDRELTRELPRELEFTAWMRTTGVTARQINEATGTEMGGHYLTSKSQPAIPTAALMDKMRHLLPEVPEWVETTIAAREAEKEEARQRNAGARFLQTLELGSDPYEVTLEEAERWQGWGTALKPGFEPIVVGRKPLAGTVAGNVLAHGTGALNIDGCRVPATDGGSRVSAVRTVVHGGFEGGLGRPGDVVTYETPDAGRWPTNVVLDLSQAADLDRQSGVLTSGVLTSGVLAAHHARAPKDAGILGAYGSTEGERGYGDSGGASRFFPTFRYEAKAPTSERPRVGEVAHPTVKPLDLMRWLVRLVTPPGGTVLEPFAGSGTTIEAAVLEGFQCIAIEKHADYLPLIRQRLGLPVEAGQ